MTPLLALLQEDLHGVSISHFFAGVFLILLVYGGALLFTYWISKDE
jgi:hypothetical protein